MDENKQIAETILAQLGGSRFIAMTGARDFFYDGPSLSFRLPTAAPKNRANRVKIALTEMGLYDITFFNVGRAPKFKVAEVGAFSMVYCDQLCDLFTAQTGLDTAL